MGSGSDMGAGLGSAAANIAILLGAAGKGGKKERKRVVELWNKLQLPDFDMRDLTAPELKIVAEYLPQIYEASMPEGGVALPEDSPQTRNAQMGALDYLQRVQRQGLPVAERLAAQEAQDSIGMASRRTQQAILNEMAQRGRLGAVGGGTEIGARIAGNQQARDMSASMGSALARDAVLNRLNAAMASGQLGGQVRQADIDISSQRANAINRFNEWFHNLRTMAARDSALSTERAQSANAGNQQRVADTNAMSRYSTALANLERQNQLRQNMFNAAVTKTTGQSGAYENLGRYRDAEQAARAQSIRSIGEGAGQALGSGFDFFKAGGFGGF